MKLAATRKALEMLERGRKLETLLPGWQLIGVDPGYLFTRKSGYGSIDLPEDVVEAILALVGTQRDTPV